jgi:mono/diheme cytochrome c family protein
MKRITTYLALFLLLTVSAFATDFPVWEVPAEAASLKNPVEANKKAISAGETVYKTQCIACHGPNADGIGAIPAANLRTENFLSQSDGAIFHKLEVGRGTMPSFKALGEETLWNVIHYLRSLNAPADQKVKEKSRVEIKVSERDGKRFATAFFFRIDPNGSESPAAEAKGGIFVKRYFGNLPISQATPYTNASGKITAEIPADIRGDQDGNFLLMAILDDSGFETAQAELALTGGVIPENTFNDQWETQHALWRTNEYLPWWIKAMYFGITGGVLLAIGYVMLLIRKIKLAGKE